MAEDFIDSDDPPNCSLLALLFGIMLEYLGALSLITLGVIKIIWGGTSLSTTTYEVSLRMSLQWTQQVMKLKDGELETYGRGMDYS